MGPPPSSSATSELQKFPPSTHPPATTLSPLPDSNRNSLADSTMPPTRRSSTLAKQAAKRRIVDEEEDESHDDVAPTKSEDDQTGRKETIRDSRTTAQEPIAMELESKAVDSKVMTKDVDVDMDVDDGDVSDSRSPSVANSSSQAGGKQTPTLKVRLKLGRSKGKQQRPVPEASPEEDEIEDFDENDDPQIDVESEDNSDESESDDSSDEAPKSTAPLTARQAALAGVGEGKGPHISLDEVNLSQRRRGPQKTAEELEAKRHEAAKKRKIQMDQKVKNEKRDAVDRLLNKQAPRPRAKRRGTNNTNTGYNTPLQPSGTQTPALEVPETRSTSPEGEGSGSGSTSQTPSLTPAQLPTTLRWISSSRSGSNGSRPPLITMLDEPSTAPNESVEDSVLGIIIDASDQVPVSEAGSDTAKDAAASMDIDKNGDSADHGPSVPAEPSITGSLSVTDEGGTVPSESSVSAQSKQPAPSFSFTLAIPPSLLHQTTTPSLAATPVPASPPRQCGVEGCLAGRKYRVVCGGGVEKGACGLDHFKILKQGSSAVAV